ncbi:hypothetical protein HNY73_002241 [Argiope bruennichi]|uniref:Uncharacterized protein n=1 Tax=Argiope bruennichi TaxID=94029 RepID=A0A8T0FZD5_ARGBR|nr:hypothetical protein HNY73_002241 [Argiope bruennichi]
MATLEIAASPQLSNVFINFAPASISGGELGWMDLGGWEFLLFTVYFEGRQMVPLVIMWASPALFFNGFLEEVIIFHPTFFGGEDGACSRGKMVSHDLMEHLRLGSVLCRETTELYKCCCEAIMP